MAEAATEEVQDTACHNTTQLAVARKYVRREGEWCGIDADAIALAESVIDIYPEVPRSNSKTRLRRAFNRAIAGQSYSSGVLRKVKMLLSDGMNSYQASIHH